MQINNENFNNFYAADNDGDFDLGGGGAAAVQTGFSLEYYSKSDACLLSDMRTHNSPNLIFGLIEYITEIKNNPKSILFEYYRKRIDDMSQ